MSDNCSKIICGSTPHKVKPKISIGKFLFDHFKQGNENLALVDAHSGNTLRYDQILQHSIKLVHYYKKNDIKKGDIIAILSENDINYILPVLAATYMGATVHFVNAHLTLWELSTMFDISKPKWIFCSDNALAKATQLKSQFQCIQNIVTFGARTENATSLEELFLTHDLDLSHFEPDELNPEEDVAFIFNSSGTSGFPKGVMFTHYNIVTAIENRFSSCKEYHNLQQGEAMLVATPLSHIMGLLYMTGALVTLGTCILMKKFIPELYLKSIELHKVKTISCSPLLIKFLAQSPLVDLFNLSSLKDITSGSAASDSSVESLVRERLNITPRQMYGATETVGAFLLSPVKVDMNKVGSCGKVTPERKVKVCDVETQALLGPKQPGEICVKSPILMKGYMGNPEETKNSFDGDGFYRTGDVGYYDEDGYFYIVDRLKDLIKYKGFQVSPSELEFLISKHPAVKEVAVIGISDERAGEVPLAYVIPNNIFRGNISEKEIIEFVAEHVSTCKRLYGGVKFVEDIPKNANGKILKRVLREMHDNNVK